MEMFLLGLIVGFVATFFATYMYLQKKNPIYRVRDESDSQGA